jgi:hypothetical protein
MNTIAPRLRLVRLFPVLVLGLISACGTLVDARDAAQQSWEVTLTISGGFAGVDRTVAASSDGALRVADRRRASDTTRPLTAGELQQTVGVLARLSADTTAAIDRRNPRCRDCFLYQIVYTRDGTRRQATLDSTTLASSPYAALVELLTGLASHRSGEAGRDRK